MVGSGVVTDDLVTKLMAPSNYKLKIQNLIEKVVQTFVLLIVRELSHQEIFNYKYNILKFQHSLELQNFLSHYDRDFVFLRDNKFEVPMKPKTRNVFNVV